MNTPHPKEVQIQIRRFGIQAREARALLALPRPAYDRVMDRLGTFRAQNGWPVSNAPLTRGKLLELIAAES